MVSPKTIFALSWRAAAICLFSAVTGACCGNLTHHHPAPTLLGDVHHVHSPYYSCPGCKELVPKHLPHRCGHPVELPFFGYEATCWAPWPTGWIGCPPIVEQRYPMPCPPLPEMIPPCAAPGAPMFEPVPSHLIPHPTPAPRAPRRIESDEPPAPPMREDADLNDPPAEDDASSFGIRPLDLSFRGAEIQPNPPAPASRAAAPVNAAISSAPRRPETPRGLAPPAIAKEERPLRSGRGLRSTLRAARNFSPPETQPRAVSAPSIAAAPEIVERAETTPALPAAPPVRSLAASSEATEPAEAALSVASAAPAETAKVVEAKPMERALVVEATPTLETAAPDEAEAVQFAVDATQLASRDAAGASQAPGAVSVEYVQPPLWLAGAPQSRERRPAAPVRTTQKSAEASDARQTIVELVTHLISARRDDNRPAKLR